MKRLFIFLLILGFNSIVLAETEVDQFKKNYQKLDKVFRNSMTTLEMNQNLNSVLSLCQQELVKLNGKLELNFKGDQLKAFRSGSKKWDDYFKSELELKRKSSSSGTISGINIASFKIAMIKSRVIHLYSFLEEKK